MKRLFMLVIALLLVAALPAAAQDDAVLDDFRELLDWLEVDDDERAFALLLSEQLPQNRTVDGAFILGALDAPITLIEFADFACPHCQNYHPEIVQFITELVASGEAAYEFRFLPTAGGERTIFMGHVLACAEDQQAGAFWRGYFLAWRYIESEVYFTNFLAQKLAFDLNLDYDDLLACTDESARVATDLTYALELGAAGTPSVFIRYGDSPAQRVVFAERTYDSGGVPFNVLVNVVRADD